MHGLTSTERGGRLRISLGSARAADGPAEGIRCRRPRDVRGIGLNIVPLVDVTFLLMIFFVIAGSLQTWEGVLGSRMLPAVGGAGGAKVAPLPLSPIVVRLTREGASNAEYAIRLDVPSGLLHSFNELAERLADLRQCPGFDAETPIVFVVDDDLDWDHAVNGWNAAVRAGYKKLGFAKRRP